MSSGASADARVGRADRTGVLWTFLGTLASAIASAPLDHNSQHLIVVALGALISALITEGRRGLVVVIVVAAFAWFVTCGSGTGLARLAPSYQAYLPSLDPPPPGGGSMTPTPTPTPTVPSETPDVGTRPHAPATVTCTAVCTIDVVGTGTSPVLIDGYTFSGAHPGFTVMPADDGCSGKTLEPGEPCTIAVTFTADPAGGTRQATLLIHEPALRALPNRVTLVGGEATAGPWPGPSTGPTSTIGGRGGPTSSPPSTPEPTRTPIAIG